MYTHENKSRKITFLSLKKIVFLLYVCVNKQKKAIRRRLLIEFYYDVSLTVLY